MLSYNSIVYIAYTLVLIVIITCLTYMNAEACSGYDLVEKTEMQDERIGKIYMGFCSVFITVVMVVFSIIWPPVLLDVPEYLSGTGETVTGTITEFTDKIRPVEGEWALVSAKIQDENTKKIVSIKKTYFPYVQVGDQVTVSYLRHCKMGMVATVYKGNIIKNLIMDCQSYTKYRPNETTGGIFVSWRRKEELPTGA